MADSCDAYNASATTRPFPEHLGGYVGGWSKGVNFETCKRCHIPKKVPNFFFEKNIQKNIIFFGWAQHSWLFVCSPKICVVVVFLMSLLLAPTTLIMC